MDEKTRRELNARGREHSRFWPENMPMPGMYFDRAGTPIGLGDWAALCADEDYRRVKFTDLGFAHVSTIWLGMNMSFWLEAPLIFETMVFNATPKEFPGSPLFGIEPYMARASWDEWSRRHATEDEARAYHRQVVRQLRRGSPKGSGQGHGRPRGR